MQEFVRRVQGALAEPWKKGTGCPKLCGLYRATENACMYLRQNATQEFIGNMRDISQPTVSTDRGTTGTYREIDPGEIRAVRGEGYRDGEGPGLADGTITPCRSHEDLWVPVGAENSVTLCDLRIPVNQATEPVPAQEPDVCAESRLMRTPGRWALLQCPVRPVRVVVIDVLAQDQPQVPLAGDQDAAEALEDTAEAAVAVLSAAGQLAGSGPAAHPQMRASDSPAPLRSARGRLTAARVTADAHPASARADRVNPRMVVK